MKILNLPRLSSRSGSLNVCEYNTSQIRHISDTRDPTTLHDEFFCCAFVFGLCYIVRIGPVPLRILPQSTFEDRLSINL